MKNKVKYLLYVILMCPFYVSAAEVSLSCPSSVNSRYLYYVLQNNQDSILSKVRRSSVPRLSRSVLENMMIPIPPIDYQNRVVSILDKFYALSNDIASGIPAEIEARTKQYEYYRDILLKFDRVA